MAIIIFVNFLHIPLLYNCQMSITRIHSRTDKETERDRYCLCVYRAQYTNAHCHDTKHIDVYSIHRPHSKKKEKRDTQNTSRKIQYGEYSPCLIHPLQIQCINSNIAIINVSEKLVIVQHNLH